MLDHLRYLWLPRLCFLFTSIAALALLAAVLLAPWLLPERSPPRLLELFARDATVRRTAIGAAVGLLVTAFLFFRPAVPRPKKPSPKEPPTGNMAGA
jgi:hypothetical protein